MKRLSILVAALAFSLTSCNNQAEQNTASKEENTPKEGRHHDGHPPRDGDHKGPRGHSGEKGHPPHGERKGPPRGGSPEQTKTLEEIGGYKIGEVATDFSLKNVDGKMVSLADFEDAKGYIVTFTCNECPFSKMYEDRLIELHNTYAPQGYPVIAINPNSPANEKEGYEAMQVRAEEKGFPFPYLVDEGQKIYPQYGAVRTPHVFLLDENRTVQYIGTVDNNAKSPEDVTIKYVEDAIAALQKGEKPNPNFTKAIGCPVKASKA